MLNFITYPPAQILKHSQPYKRIRVLTFQYVSVFPYKNTNVQTVLETLRFLIVSSPRRTPACSVWW